MSKKIKQGKAATYAHAVSRTETMILNDAFNVFSSPLELVGAIPDRATKEQIAAIKPGEIVCLQRHEIATPCRRQEKTEQPDKLITISHAASIIGVSPTTLRSWIDKGELQTWVSPGGRARVREGDARGFWQRGGGRDDGIAFSWRYGPRDGWLGGIEVKES